MNARALAVGIVLWAWEPASAYWAKNHQAMNKQVFAEGTPWRTGFTRGTKTIVHPLEYLRHVLYVRKPDTEKIGGIVFDKNAIGFGTVRALGNDTPDNGQIEFKTPQEWNEWGGIWEDGFLDLKEGTQWGGRRAVNHFHDPLASGGGGYTGITEDDEATGRAVVDLLRKGISASEWVMNGTSGGALNGKNYWGYPTVGQSLHKFFTEPQAIKRQLALSAALRSLGQVQHLIEDETVPDHARDLPHPGNGWEEFMGQARADRFGSTPQPWVEFPITSVEKGGIRAFWDRDVYSGNPAPTLSTTDPAGLAEYVNANFLAWNVMYEAAGVTLPRPLEFTTIPDELQSPFVRGWSIRPSKNAQLGLTLRTNTINYPWPQLGGLEGANYRSEPGSLSLNPIASEVNGKILDGRSWNNYLDPLMRQAHGYAQSVLSLALQPVRAELITDFDPLKMGVRLWNLWPAGGPHSVTWHIEELTVVGIRKDGSPADDVPIHWVEVRDVAPGAVVDSGLQTLTWKQRGAMAYDTHMAVLIKAHLGDAKQTPLLFSVPIPNGYALIKQTSGLDVTGPTANSEGNCRTGGGCAFSGEVAFYRNPLAQRVTGTIELKATELDTLGRNAAIDPAVLTAMHDDTRIAQVMLFAWPRDAAHQDLVPVQAVLSKLTLTGSNLKQVAPGRWVREDKAPDEADGPIGFTADLQLSEFYFADKGISIFDAHRASGSVYVGITTTSGSFQVQRLILWPLRSKLPMAQLLIPACNLSVPRTTAIDLAEDRAICTIGGSTGSCMGHYQRVQTIFADWGGGATEPPGNDIFTLGLAVGGGSNNCRPITFVGAPVNLSGSAMLPADCNPNAIVAVWPNGTGQTVCDYLAPSGLALFSTQNFDFSGSTCPTSGPQKLPYRVTYKRLFPPLLVEGLKKTFGWKDAPAEWTFDIQ